MTLWRQKAGLIRVAAAALTLLSACAREPVAEAVPDVVATPDPLRVAEDLRGTGPEGLAPILSGLRDADPARRVLAARALGRLERADLVDTLRSGLYDPSAAVRAEAANALAQAAVGPDVVPTIYGRLAGRVVDESDPGVQGALAAALGRLPYGATARADSAETLVVGIVDGLLEASQPQALVEATLGLSAFYRVGQRRPSGAAQRSIARLADWGRAESSLEAARVRRLATSLLPRLPEAQSGPLLEAALGDPDADVRRVAIAGLASGAPALLRDRLPLAISDPEPRVRIEALRAWERTLKASRGCEPLLFAVREGDPQVVNVALELLGRPCPEAARQRTTLMSLAGELSTAPTWHAPARALVALASTSPDRIAGLIGPFERHQNPFVRAYAARAATLASRTEVLERLSADPDANVRTAALSGRVSLAGHAVDDALTEALGADDPQLVLTAAQALEGSPDGAERVGALLAALERLSAKDMETLRDPRMALLQRVEEFADSSLIRALERYSTDRDPVVAAAAAAALTRRTGVETSAAPRPRAPGPLPIDAELDRWARTRVLLDMERGGRIGLRLLPALAPTNVARFVDLVRSGRLRGLTFHRVEPNFVVQGASPGANEYAGHGAYTRDEVGRVSHWRGTVGISTRGRDTGDGQIFFNLVDNVRLDHAYTVFAEVELGLDVVDAILEGDRILDATLVEGSAPETGRPDRP